MEISSHYSSKKPPINLTEISVGEFFGNPQPRSSEVEGPSFLLSFSKWKNGHNSTRVQGLKNFGRLNLGKSEFGW